MDTNKDYYAILGVLPSAEDVVIRAAYKALAQRYHPDRNPETRDEAARRMVEINEAYGVLSDPVTRGKYDAARGTEKERYRDEPDEPGAADPFQSDWAVAIRYFPEIDEPRERLKKISHALEFTYRAVLLDGKAFDSAAELANKMEQQFLQLYFGKDPRIISLAQELIFSGNKAGAKELNEAIRVLGTNIDLDRVVAKIRSAFGLPTINEKKCFDRISDLVSRIESRASDVYARVKEVAELARLLGCQAEEVIAAWGNAKLYIHPLVTGRGGIRVPSLLELNISEIDSWTGTILLPAAKKYLKSMV